MGQYGVPTGQSLPIVAPRIIAFGLPVTAVTAKRDSGCRICRMKTDNMQSTDAARGMDALPYPALHGVSSCPSNSSTRWWPCHSWLYSRWLAKLSCDHAAESTVLAPGGRPRHVGKKTARNPCRIPCRVKSWPISCNRAHTERVELFDVTGAPYQKPGPAPTVAVLPAWPIARKTPSSISSR